MEKELKDDPGQGPMTTIDKVKHESRFDNIINTVKNVGTQLKESIEELPKLKDDVILAGKGIKDLGVGFVEKNGLLTAKGIAELSEAGKDGYERIKQHIPMGDQDPTKPETLVKQTPSLTDRVIPVRTRLHDAHIPGRNEQPSFPMIRQKTAFKPIMEVEYIKDTDVTPLNNTSSQVAAPRAMGTTVPVNHRGTFEQLTGFN